MFPLSFPLLVLTAIFSGCGQGPTPVNTDLPVVYDFSERIKYAQNEKPWTVLDMGTQEAGRFLNRDWEKTPHHSANIPCRWALGRKPAVRFLVFRKTDLTLVFSCYPYSRSFPGQKVSVYVNDHKAGAFKLPRGRTFQDHEVKIPANMLALGENRIVFRFRYRSHRHRHAACFKTLTLTPSTLASSQLLDFRSPPWRSARQGGVNSSPPDPHPASRIPHPASRFRQPPSSRLSWRMVAPENGYLTVLPSFSNGAHNACTVSFRHGDNRVVLAAFTNEPDHEITVPFAAPNGARGIIDFDAFGESPVLWQKTIVGGRIDTRRSNVFLLTVDSLRADHVGSYLYQRDTTPFMDRLAARGVLFEHAFTASNKSVPSHATMLTGRYPQSHGIISNRDELDSQQMTLARILRKEGFATSAHVNWRLLSLSSRTGNGFRKTYHVDGMPQKIGLSERDNPYACAAQWIEEYWEQPLFSWIHSQFLHMTDFPDDYAMRYVAPDLAPAARTLIDRIARKGTRDVFNKYESDPATLTQETASVMTALYDANLNFTDDFIAAFMEKLKDCGLDPFSAIIITSDHGSHLGERGRFGHLGTPHNHLIHVPLICFLPGSGQQPGRRVGGLVETVDIAPTILSYLRLPIPRRMQGHDLMPLARGEKDQGRNAAFVAVGQQGRAMGYAIRTADWLYFFNSEDDEALIDMDKDNGRLISLIDTQPEKRKELRRILAKWIDATPVVGTGESRPISEEIRQMLIKGGYLEDAE